MDVGTWAGACKSATESVRFFTKSWLHDFLLISSFFHNQPLLNTWQFTRWHTSGHLSITLDQSPCPLPQRVTCLRRVPRMCSSFITQTCLPVHHHLRSVLPLKCSIAAPSQTCPILRPSDSPAWDSGAVSCPCIHRYITDTGPSYAMWYSGRPAHWPGASDTPPGTLGGYTGLALSTDGLIWTRVEEPLLSPNEDWWWFDTTHLSVGKVLVDSNDRVRADAGIYMMYYSGGDKRKLSVRFGEKELEMRGIGMRIGVAISKDGEHFTRIEGEYPSGAVLEGDGFDALFVAAPDVIVVRKGRSVQYVMHYFTYLNEEGRFALGRAVSNDGFTFRKDADKPVLSDVAEDLGGYAEQGITRCRVVRRGDAYVMFAEVIDGAGVHRIAMCHSDDCATWGALRVVLEPSPVEAAWDGANVSHPEAVMMEDGSVRLYYVGKARTHNVESGNGTCIGVAQSNGADWSMFTRLCGAIAN